MKHTADWYANTGIQHTRAVVALTFSTIIVEKFIPEKGSKIADHMDIITKRIKACSTLTKKKKISAGAKRDLDNCSEILSPYMDTSKPSNDKKRFRQWAALCWAALTFIEDVIASCPAYTSGTELKKWQKLHEAMSALTDALCELEPGIDEYGTMIYECAAWALDGVPFKPDDRSELAA